jgi:putative Ca2+/H+ antiporter (TMEM165/GDT1 family)
MDALMAALIAGALAQAGDRPASLAAILSDRHRRPLPVLLAAALALALAGALACLGGALLAGRLTPAASAIFLGLALVFQGAGGFLPVKPPERLEGWRFGAFGTAFAGLFILIFGDGLQFVVLALAVRADLPWAAAVGATLGAMAVIAPAAVMGERAWTRLPQRTIRRAASALFLLAGIALGLSGLGLV